MNGQYGDKLQQMALALALSNFGAEYLADEAQSPGAAWAMMMDALVECGHGESEAESIIDAETRGWLHHLERENPTITKNAQALIERFAWSA